MVTEDLNILTKELKEISQEIYKQKSLHTNMPVGLEKERLRIEIKDKQFQMLFYIEKIEKLAKNANAGI